MEVVVILVALLLIGAITALFFSCLNNRKIQKKIDSGELKEFPNIKQVQSMECCGQHEICEKDSLLAAVSKQIEYYNDEELDSYQGRASDDYTEEEVDEFREVLYTMKEVEVAGWVRSLQLRAIELPDDLKDEVFLIVGERRMTS
ncbi:MAG: phospholipase [Bacteroidaceae bacterium]|nr:phospholipase [Bacteroidaceae bacterium]